MNSKRVAFIVAAVVAALGAAYAVLAMFTQGMLGGISASEVRWDRIVVWWVDFLAAGLLLMLAVYLWRRSGHTVSSRSSNSGKWRVVILPVGHLLLTGSLFFADFAWYLREYEAGEAQVRSGGYLFLAILLLGGSALAFWWARKLHKKVSAA